MAHLECCAKQIHSGNPCTCGEELRVREANNTLTLRDRFAMAALTGMLANESLSAKFDGSADDAYRYADAMMKERER